MLGTHRRHLVFLPGNTLGRSTKEHLEFIYQGWKLWEMSIIWLENKISRLHSRRYIASQRRKKKVKDLNLIHRHWMFTANKHNPRTYGYFFFTGKIFISERYSDFTLALRAQSVTHETDTEVWTQNSAPGILPERFNSTKAFLYGSLMG